MASSNPALVRAPLWSPPTPAQTVVTNAEMASDAVGVMSVGAAVVDNDVDRLPLGIFELTLGSINPTGAPFVEIWIFYSFDGGTSYEDQNLFAGHARKLDLAISTGASAKLAVHGPVLLLPLKFKVATVNRAIAFAATGNLLELRRFR